jgi:hypothetical protein
MPNYPRYRKVVLACLTTAMLTLFMVVASPARALTYSVDRGPYDMRGFTSNVNPLFSCGTGWVGQNRVTVRAPSNYGVRVYLTTYIYHWVNGAWQQVDGGSIKPGGVWIYANGSYTFPAGSWAEGPGYWSLYVQTDFHSSTSELGAVALKATSAYDYTVYNNAVRYSGGYCWHG